MSIFYKHDWDEENKELTLYINPTKAFYEFALEFAEPEQAHEKKSSIMASVRQYAKQVLPGNPKVETYRVKFQQFLVAVLKEKKEKTVADSDFPEFGFYRVKPDDTLKDIAQMLGVREASLKKMNQISGDTLFAGMELKVPCYRHTVVASDSLMKIAQRYDTSKDAIRKINKLATDCLCLGQELKIPKPAE